MNIDDRLHEAGLHWRESQVPALRAPRLDASSEKAPSRRWMSGLVPLAASLAVAAMVIGVVILNGAPTGNPAPGATSTPSPTSSPAPTPTASTSPQTPQPTGATGPLTTTGNPAESLVVTEEIRGQLLQAGAALHGLPVSAFTGLVSGLTYYAYDPATATYWAGAGLMPSSSSLRAQVSTQDNGSYLLFRRPADKPWTAQDVGLAGVAGTKCPTSIPASVLTVWNWPARSCRPTSMASSVPTAGRLSAVSTPRSGVLGHVTILATATLAGIPATETGHLEFNVSPGPYNQGQPASVEVVPTHGPGLYTMATGYAPHQSGNWFVTVLYVPSPSQGTGPVPAPSWWVVSGMPSPTNPHPDANLVTVVTPS